MVGQVVKKNQLTLYLGLPEYSDTILMDYQQFSFSGAHICNKPQIKVDFYLYITYLVYHNASNKIFGCYTIYFFVINFFKLSIIA